jgi:hypothetical protein
MPSTASSEDRDHVPTAGSVHDSDGFWPERWEAGALYIYDLGYQSNDRFVEASLAHAHLLQRLKDGQSRGGRFVWPDGIRRVPSPRTARRCGWKEACTFGHVHQQEVLDLDVEVTDEGRTVIARVVCVPVDGEDHYYLSTLSRATFTPFDLASCTGFAGRSSFFRNWKGSAHGPCSSAPQSSLLGRRRHGLDARGSTPVGILRQALNDSRRKTSPWLRALCPETNPARSGYPPLASTPAAPFQTHSTRPIPCST